MGRLVMIKKRVGENAGVMGIEMREGKEERERENEKKEERGGVKRREGDNETER